MNITDLKCMAADCRLCSLWKGRIRPVFDKGNPKAKLMICGMVPAQKENITGVPFVGDAGVLLGQMMREHGLLLSKVYITNLVKCYLKAGEKLKGEWIESCLPYIIAQIAIIKPKVIITLGLDASVTLLNLPDNTTMASIRGGIHDYHAGSKIIPTYHPSFLLRKGREKSHHYGKVVGDFGLAMDLVEALKGEKQ